MTSIAAALARFARRHGGPAADARSGGTLLRSAGARLVDYAGPLYNVTGSTGDPDIDGQGWKRLLIARGIDAAAPCYVTDPKAVGGSHPGFNLGGHMTPNPDGRVAGGGICYLMPLCHGHNSTAMNGRPFTLARTRMLELSGFMLDDLALTFEARMIAAPYVRIDKAGDAWRVSAAKTPKAEAHSPGTDPKYYLEFRQQDDGFVIAAAKLPAVS